MLGYIKNNRTKKYNSFKRKKNTRIVRCVKKEKTSQLRLIYSVKSPFSMATFFSVNIISSDMKQV